MHVGRLLSYHITSCYMLYMLYVTQNVTLLLGISDIDWAFFFSPRPFLYNSTEKENLKIREDKEASPLED